MKGSVVALLDRPSTQSLGMVPFVCREASGDLVVDGLSGGLDGTITPAHLSQLLLGGHALDVERCKCELDAESPSAAGWAGDGFLVRGYQLGAPIPRFPAVMARHPHGSFWIAARGDVYACLQDWTERAGRKAVRNGDRELAKLMRWALPNAVETQTALWCTAVDRDSVVRDAARLARCSPDELVAAWTREERRLRGDA